MKDTHSKSAEIRKLYDEGMPTTEIAKLLNIRYQFVYNVVSRHKKGQVINDKGSSDVKNSLNPRRKEKTVGTRMFSRMNYQVIRGMKELLTKQEMGGSRYSNC